MSQNKSTNKLLLTSGIAILGLGIAYWLYNQYTLFTKYCYKIKDIKFNAVGMNKTNITIFMLFRNFSSVKATVTELDMAISLNDKLISNVKNNITQTIEANSVSEIRFDIEFSAKELFKTNIGDALKMVADLTTNKENIVFKFVGTASIKIGLLNIRKLKINTSLSLKDILADDPNAFVCDI